MKMVEDTKVTMKMKALHLAMKSLWLHLTDMVC
jgi:hypothetical protein